MKKKVFLAEAIDNVDEIEVSNHYGRVRSELAKLDLEVISAYHILGNGTGNKNHSRKRESAYIVEKDLELLETCDLLLVDLSRKGHFYLGCIFELAYACYKYKIPKVVICDPTIASRYWLLYHADRICHSLSEAVDAIRELITPDTPVRR